MERRQTGEGGTTGRARPQSAAERKRRQRDRLQRAGLAPVEVWIPAEHRPFLRHVEQLLRRGVVPALGQPDGMEIKGNRIMDINLLRETLDDYTSPNGFRFAAADMGDDGAVEVVVEDRQEFPILVSVDDEQVLCLTYLWDEGQVKADSRTEMMATLLEMNVPLPLSSFGKIGDRYVVFGALAANATVEDVITELEILSDNTLEAIEVVSPFLN
jgi:uncharacterized protein YjfI (DUF2170 family)